jgi:hypothetical protein
MKSFIYFDIKKTLIRQKQRLLSIWQQFVGNCVVMHQFANTNGVYKRLIEDGSTVLINGFVVWIILIPFTGALPLYTIVSFGLLVIFSIEYWKKIKHV